MSITAWTPAILWSHLQLNQTFLRYEKTILYISNLPTLKKFNEYNLEFYV